MYLNDKKIPIKELAAQNPRSTTTEFQKDKPSQTFIKSSFQPSTIFKKPQTGLIYNILGRSPFCLQSHCWSSGIPAAENSWGCKNILAKYSFQSYTLSLASAVEFR